MAQYKPIPQLTPQQVESFWSRVDIDMVDTDACFDWLGARSAEGYGRVRFGSMFWAHRVAYTLVHGPVPDGMTIDHLCRHRRCCNPAHLEAVLTRVNVLRGTGPTAINAVKARCVNGHPFDGKNTYVNAIGKRVCRRCDADRQKPMSAKDARAKGLCVQCRQPSSTYRCARCRAIHNQNDRTRSR